ncbi:MAG: ABC transporter ATP-binding protein [Actinomycetota bacterium]|nr:ABC transporter ATP-binding protein [Actinomycetota bacterium]
MTIPKFIRRVITEQPLRITLVVGTMVAASLLEGIAIAFLVPLLNLATGDANATGAGGRVVVMTQKVFSLLGLSTTIENTLVLIFLIAISQQTLTLVQQKLFFGSLYRFQAHLRGQLYQAIFDAGWPFFLKQKVGHLTSALTTEVERACSAFSQLMLLMTACTTIAVYLFLALFVSIKMTLASMLIGGTLVVVLRKRRARAIEYGNGISQANADLQSEATEQISGAKLIKGCAIEESTVSQFSKYLNTLAQIHLKNSLNEVWLKAIYELSSIGVLCSGIYVALARFHMPLANLILFLFIFYRLVPRLSSSQGNIHFLMASLPGLDRIEALQAEAAAMREQSGNIKLSDLSQSVALKGLCFGYIPDKTILNNIDLELAAGKTTAIVGSSGAGKSTIVDLIMGLVVPEKGMVLIDGVDLQTVNLSSWRNLIGYVAQDTILFHTTVKANIAWGQPSATDEEIIAAAKTAYAHDFIDRLPDGYETIVGDRGVRLSGGQRQRLALARALVRKPKLLILDEATSALDAESEKKIQKAVEMLARFMTIMIVTHRLATVKNADLIHVLENGRLVESGSWKDLQTAGGRLHTLKQLQALD